MRAIILQEQLCFYQRINKVQKDNLMLINETNNFIAIAVFRQDEGFQVKSKSLLVMGKTRKTE